MYSLPPLDLVITHVALASIARNRATTVRDWQGFNIKHGTLKGHILY